MADDKKGPSLRADLQEYYGICVDGLFSGELSWVHVAELVAQLRSGSRLSGGWSQEEHLMADHVDLLTRQVWLQGLATSAALDKKDRKLLNRPPKPIERPGLEKKKLKFTETKDLVRLLDRRRAIEEAASNQARAHNKAAALQVLRSL